MDHRLDSFGRLNRRRRYSANGGLDSPRSRLLASPVSASTISASAPPALPTLAARRMAAAFARLARGYFDCDSGGLRLFGGDGGLFGLFLLRQLPPFQNRVRDARGEQPHRAQRVVIAGNDVVDSLGAAIRIDHRHDRNAQPVGLFDRDLLFVRVDHEEHVRKLLHLLDAGQVLLQRLALAFDVKPLFLRVSFDAAVGLHRLDLFKPLDGLLNCLEISKKSAEPALVNVKLIAAHRLFFDRVLRLPLRSNEQDGFACPLAAQIGDELDRLFEHALGFLQVNNVNAVAFAEDVFFHLPIPTPNLMPEVDTSLEQLFHCYCRQSILRIWFMYSPAHNSRFVQRTTNDEKAMD